MLHTTSARPDKKAITLPPVSILVNSSLNQAPPTPSKSSRSAVLDNEPAIIVVGKDDQEKPHASWFPLPSVDDARRAADRMAMHAIKVDTSIQAIAAKLPAGKLFQSGLAFVPFVKREVFDRLMAGIPADEQARIETARLALAAEKAAQRASEEADEGGDIELPPLKPGQLPPDWSKIKVGSVVLASDRQSDGWWEAIVEAEKPDNLLVLRWRQAPDMDQFLRRLDQVALLPIAYRGGE